MTPAELRERVRLELAYSTTAQSLIRIDAAIRVVVEACAEIAADWPNDGNEGVSDTYHCQLGDAAAVKREIAAGLRALLPEAPDAPTRTELLIAAALRWMDCCGAPPKAEPADELRRMLAGDLEQNGVNAFLDAARALLANKEPTP